MGRTQSSSNATFDNIIIANYALHKIQILNFCNHACMDANKLIIMDICRLDHFDGCMDAIERSFSSQRHGLIMYLSFVQRDCLKNISLHCIRDKGPTPNLSLVETREAPCTA